MFQTVKYCFELEIFISMSGKATNGKVRCNPKSSIDLLKYGILHIPTTLKIILADNRRDPKNSD